MKILILEDETLAMERLKDLLARISPEYNVVGTARSVEMGLIWLKENPEPDCILSDIQLLDGLAFEIYQENPVKCPVIFTTAYDEYALKAFEVNSVDYLLKPIQEPKLKEALARVKTRIKSPLISPSDLDSLAAMLAQREKRFKSRFLVRLGQKIQSIPTEEIAYFYTEDKVTFLISHKKERFPTNQSLDELELMLNPEHFFRINRKFLITIEAVKAIHPHFKGRLKLELNPEFQGEIVVSSEKTPALKVWLDT